MKYGRANVCAEHRQMETAIAVAPWGVLHGRGELTKQSAAQDALRERIPVRSFPPVHIPSVT